MRVGKYTVYYLYLYLVEHHRIMEMAGKRVREGTTSAENDDGDNDSEPYPDSDYAMSLTVSVVDGIRRRTRARTAARNGNGITSTYTPSYVLTPP